MFKPKYIFFLQVSIHLRENKVESEGGIERGEVFDCLT